MVKESRYKEELLVEEFKRGMNRVIRQKLIELEYLWKALSSGINRYEWATNFDRH